MRLNKFRKSYQNTLESMILAGSLLKLDLSERTRFSDREEAFAAGRPKETRGTQTHDGRQALCHWWGRNVVHAHEMHCPKSGEIEILRISTTTKNLVHAHRRSEQSELLGESE